MSGHARSSLLGLGTSQMGNLGRVTSDEEAEQTFEAAWCAGIRLFDTAPHYGLGLAERRLGTLLAGRPRSEFQVSTKVGRLLIQNPGGAASMDTEGFAVRATLRREWDFTRDGVRRSIEESLERLGLDRIDTVYLHDPDDHGDEAVATAFPALAELRAEGTVGSIGAGMNQSAMLARFIRADVGVDTVMLAGRFTLLEQGALDDLLPLALSSGVEVVVAGVYNSGILAEPRPPADASYDYAPAPSELIRRANAIAEVCEEYDVDLPTAALAYPLTHPAVCAVVVGARTASQLQSTLDRFQATVPDALWSALREADLLPPFSIPIDRKIT